MFLSAQSLEMAQYSRLNPFQVSLVAEFFVDSPQPPITPTQVPPTFTRRSERGELPPISQFSALLFFFKKTK